MGEGQPRARCWTTIERRGATPRPVLETIDGLGATPRPMLDNDR